MFTVPSDSESTRSQLLNQLRPPGPGAATTGNSERVRRLIEQLELEQPADLVVRVPCSGVNPLASAPA